HLKTHKYGKQFVATTSYSCKMLFASVLHDVINDLLHKNAPKSFIAEKYGVNPPIISYIMKKLHGLVDDNGQYRELVRSPTEDIAIGIDETFVKIRRKTVYIIMAVGYTSHKILGLLVSERRTEKELRRVFDEANRNTRKPIEVVTSDAWGATRKMIKELNYPITHIVHVHKKPYKDVYIWHYEYSGGKRHVLEIGIKADFFKKRAKRRIYVKIYDEPLNPPAKKKRGGRKGAKTRRRDRIRRRRPIMAKRKSGAEKVCVKYSQSGR
ncbi:MAG: DDE-type integrase/transposase/recombinase, partial [Promethearchaeota archaeon]